MKIRKLKKLIRNSAIAFVNIFENNFQNEISFDLYYNLFHFRFTTVIKIIYGEWNACRRQAASPLIGAEAKKQIPHVRNIISSNEQKKKE